jgi:hypothetical protein
MNPNLKGILLAYISLVVWEGALQFKGYYPSYNIKEIPTQPTHPGPCYLDWIDFFF